MVVRGYYDINHAELHETEIKLKFITRKELYCWGLVLKKHVPDFLDGAISGSYSADLTD